MTNLEQYALSVQTEKWWGYFFCRGCEACPAQTYCHAQPSGTCCRENFLQWAKTKAAGQPNAPLTLEELGRMETGEWLWIECLERFKSDMAVSAYYRKHRDYTQGAVFCCGYPGVSFGFDFSDYGASWLAYRRKPDGGGE